MSNKGVKETTVAALVTNCPEPLRDDHKIGAGDRIAAVGETEGELLVAPATATPLERH